MNSIEHIRRKVFDVTQAEFAAFAGVSQPTVSKWESGELEPSRDDLSRIRDEARARELKWDDGWFFNAPPTVPSDSEAAA